nr:lipopolysaccharide assembly protein LapA domain-containing protein [Pseudomonas sp. G(2018)]
MVFALIFLLISFVVIFVLENNEQIALVFFGWSTPQLSLSLYMVLALLAGLGVGSLLGWFARTKKCGDHNN